MRVLRRIVCCVFGGFLEVIAKHTDHGDTLLNGYPGTRAPGAKNPTDFGSDPDPVEGSTRPGKPAGYPGSKRTGGTPRRDARVCGYRTTAMDDNEHTPRGATSKLTGAE